MNNDHSKPPGYPPQGYPQYPQQPPYPAQPPYQSPGYVQAQPPQPQRGRWSTSRIALVVFASFLLLAGIKEVLRNHTSSFTSLSDYPTDFEKDVRSGCEREAVKQGMSAAFCPCYARELKARVPWAKMAPVADEIAHGANATDIAKKDPDVMKEAQAAAKSCQTTAK